jgi:hypothetical protein
MAKGWTVEKSKDPETTAAAVQPVMVGMTTDQLQALLAGLPQSGGGGISAADLKALLDSQKADREETRTVRRSNADHTHVSAFSHALGDLKQPKAKLTRETYFNNHRESEDELTPAEIEAFNAITESCEARGGYANGGWSAVVKGNRLKVDVTSYTIDDRMNLPNGLVLILKELAEGPRAVTPENMATRIAELERIVKAQQAASEGVLVAP